MWSNDEFEAFFQARRELRRSARALRELEPDLVAALRPERGLDLHLSLDDFERGYREGRAAREREED